MRRALLLVAVSLGGSPLAARAQPAPHAGRASSLPAVTRESLEALGFQLDRAVDRVSLPRVAGLLARDAARGYRLPGYGVVFVLTPRALPGAGHNVFVQVSPHGGAAHGGPARPQPAGEPEVETLERHVVILQNETEQARQAAEEDMERIVHDLRVRLLASDAPQPALAAPDVQVLTPPEHAPATRHDETAGRPSAGDAPAATTPAAPAGRGLAPAAGGHDAPSSAESSLPPPPPWKFWFQTGGTRDERSPQAMIADVRSALVEALQGYAARVAGLRPEEFVTVAVDFELPDPFAARPRPERTLVVRARAADVAARARAAIDAEEFRRRVEVLEY